MRTDRVVCARDLLVTNATLLSPREKLLLRRLAKGRSDHDIAVDIGGRPDQVCQQRQRLLAKLNISSRSEIAKAAHQLAYWPTAHRP
jgi:DNA-binding NarL/FixJ family response regulator